MAVDPPMEEDGPLSFGRERGSEAPRRLALTKPASEAPIELDLQVRELLRGPGEAMYSSYGTYR